MTTARERALLAAFVFLLLLGSVAALASWRARSEVRRHESLEQGTAVVAALHDARSQFLLASLLVTVASFAEDQAVWLDSFDRSIQAVSRDLGQARAGLIATGQTHELTGLDVLSRQMVDLKQDADELVVVRLSVGNNLGTDTKQYYDRQLWPKTEAMITRLEQLARRQEASLAAEHAAGAREAHVAFWLMVGASGLAFVVGATALFWLVISISRSLGSLQASVSAIRAGNLEVKAKVSGPKEVASLARDFNEMIADRRHVEETLRESEERYRELFDNANDILYTHDLAERFTSLNKTGQQITGYTRDEALGLSIEEVVAAEHLAPVREMIRRKVAGGGPTTYELDIIAKDGRRIPLEVSTRLIYEGGKPVAIQGIGRDITERKRAEEELRERARRDPLTGALNHVAIVDELRKRITPAPDGDSHAVAMIDVDGLKATNDTYGHQAGDAVLVAVARALSEDRALVGRYGGDEFVVILPGTDRDVAEDYRQKVLAEIAQVHLRDEESGARVPVAVSIGLAFYPSEAARLEELIKLADSAMYAAKRERPVRLPGATRSRTLGGDRAAKMVGELVPLLTSPGDLNDKLQLVSHRLCVGADYDAAHCQVFRDTSLAPAAQSTFARAPDELVQAWDHQQRRARGMPLREVLERTRRPVIVDDPQDDPRFTDAQRELLRAAGLRSALVAPMMWRAEYIGNLSVASKRKAAFGPRDAEFVMAVANQVTAIVRMATLVDDLQLASDRLAEGRTGTVMLLAAAAEAHDRTTGQHLQNVRTITEALARELGHSEQEAKELGLAAVLHDIGKIRVPDSILASVGRLTDEEWELLKRHTVWGEEFLKDRPGFELAATIARSHHERWDGSGYPDRLARDAIPEAAAIVSVADAFDAMTSHRPYRAGRPVAAAVREVIECSGKQFSARVVQALVTLHSREMLPPTAGDSPDDKAAA